MKTKYAIANFAAVALVAAGPLFAVAASAQDTMKPEGMKPEGMKPEGMKSEGMKSESMKTDHMKGDAMKGDAMKSGHAGDDAMGGTQK